MSRYITPARANSSKYQPGEFVALLSSAQEPFSNRLYAFLPGNPDEHVLVKEEGGRCAHLNDECGWVECDADGVPLVSREPEEHEYAFDIKLWAIARVRAGSEQEARNKLMESADCLGLGPVTPNGVSFTEASSEGTHELVEIDGEAV